LEVEFGLINIASGVNYYIATDSSGIKPKNISSREIEDLVKILRG
jgi:hypothetical protein